MRKWRKKGEYIADFEHRLRLVFASLPVDFKHTVFEFQEAAENRQLLGTTEELFPSIAFNALSKFSRRKIVNSQELPSVGLPSSIRVNS